MNENTEILERNMKNLIGKVVELREFKTDYSKKVEDVISDIDFRPYRRLLYTYLNLADAFFNVTFNKKDTNREKVLGEVIVNINTEISRLDILSIVLIDHLSDGEVVNGETLHSSVYRCFQDILVKLINYGEKLNRIKELQ